MIIFNFKKYILVAIIATFPSISRHICDLKYSVNLDAEIT